MCEPLHSPFIYPRRWAMKSTTASTVRVYCSSAEMTASASPFWGAVIAELGVVVTLDFHHILGTVNLVLLALVQGTVDGEGVSRRVVAVEVGPQQDEAGVCGVGRGKADQIVPHRDAAVQGRFSIYLSQPPNHLVIGPALGGQLGSTPLIRPGGEQDRHGPIFRIGSQSRSTPAKKLLSTVMGPWLISRSTT